MMKNLDDKTTYARLGIDPTSKLKNKITNLNHTWKTDGYIDHNFYVKETNLPRAYGSVKLHKQDKAASRIIPCIDTPHADLSDFNKTRLTAACPRTPQFIKNTLDFKSKVKNIHVLPNHIMASLVYLFPSVPK